MPLENLTFRRAGNGAFAEWEQLQTRLKNLNVELNQARQIITQTARTFAFLTQTLEKTRTDTLKLQEIKSLQTVADKAQNLPKTPAPPETPDTPPSLKADPPTVSTDNNEPSEVLNAMLDELVAIRQAVEKTDYPPEKDSGRVNKTPPSADKEASDDNAEAVREKFLKVTDTVHSVSKIATQALSELTSAQIQRLDSVIEKQEDNVARARKLAESGNAELLQLEEERLEKLQQQRERYVRQQQALAVIELVVNSAVAIAKAAAQGGIAAPITIATTLIALAAGLAQARAQAQAAVPAAEKGGIAGKGALVDVKKGGRLHGNRHHQGGILIEAEDGERIFDRNTSRKYHTVFETLLRLKPDPEKVQHLLASAQFPALPDELLNPNILQNLTFSPVRNTVLTQEIQLSFQKLQTEMQALRETVARQERLSLTIDDKGIHAITQRLNDKALRVRKLGG